MVKSNENRTSEEELVFLKEYIKELENVNAQLNKTINLFMERIQELYGYLKID